MSFNIVAVSKNAGLDVVTTWATLRPADRFVSTASTATSDSAASTHNSTAGNVAIAIKQPIDINRLHRWLD
jgi:hypothetical protein